MQYPRMFITGMTIGIAGLWMTFWGIFKFFGLAYFFGAPIDAPLGHSAEFVATMMLGGIPVGIVGSILLHQRDDFIDNTHNTKLALILIFLMNIKQNLMIVLALILVVGGYFFREPEAGRALFKENESVIWWTLIGIWAFFGLIWKK